jgi:two-component system NtrC family sensor kinase
LSDLPGGGGRQIAFHETRLKRFSAPAMKHGETIATVEESQSVSDTRQTPPGAGSPADGARAGRRQLSFQGALFLLLGGAVIAGVVPAGILLDQRLTSELERRTRDDLARAPRVLADRSAARADAMMMHAKELAGAPALLSALARGDHAAAEGAAREAAAAFGEAPVLIDAEARSRLGPPAGSGLLDATRRGEMPTAITADSAAIWRIALAPVKQDGRWIGAAGVASPVGEAEAGLLSGLTRSTVTIVQADGRVVATTGSDALARALAAVRRTADTVRAVTAGGRVYVASWAPLGPRGAVGAVVFARDRRDELAVLPQLRRIAAASALAGLALALIVGAAVARWIAHPVEALALAADEVASGRFAAPIPASALREVSKVGRAFNAMRRALTARLGELEAANRALADRQHRLAALQAELMRRERVAATGRLLGSLAHEIRNPVANVRNCLEVVRRRLGGAPTNPANEHTREFVDLAIDELLRMHELAEQMLDLNRPRDSTSADCDAADVARSVAALAAAGPDDVVTIAVTGVPHLRVPLSPDRLTQVLLNLVQNAREAGASRIEVRLDNPAGGVTVEVEDDGPGIPPELVPRIFDPFYTTKGDVNGAGLGLFVAEGIVRTAGGRIVADGRADLRRGARFRIEFPARAHGVGEPPPGTAGDAREISNVRSSAAG